VGQRAHGPSDDGWMRVHHGHVFTNDPVTDA